MRCASELLLLLRLRWWRWANRLQSEPKDCLTLFQSDKIDKSSVPVLDYRIQIIKGNPEYLVYVRVQSIHHSNQSDIDRNSELTARRTEVVASYFEQKGISAKRLVLLDPGGAPYAFNGGAAKVQHLKNSGVLQLDFASEADSGTGPS